MNDPAQLAWSQPAADALTPLDGDGCADIWRVSLNASDTTVDEYRSLLTDDELQRADRFRFDRKQREFIMTRGTLRRVLSRTFLDGSAAAAREIEYSSGTHGKPRVVDLLAGQQVRFNVTHSGQIALIAVTTNHEIGIDIEYAERAKDFQRLAKRYFSPSEYDAFITLPSDQQSRGFYNCWTRKEAYLKALGRGITLPLDSFDVSLRPQDEPALLATRHDASQAGRWSIQEINVGDDYIAALVTNKSISMLRGWQT